METKETPSLDAILDEKSPAEATPEQLIKADYNKQAWRDKEQDAKGLSRDPVTGQYAPKEPKAEVKDEVKTEVKTEVKAEVKTEVKPEIKAPEKPLEEYSPREKAAFAKAADETRKRQALERQIEEFKKKETEKPFFEDPEGALARQKQDFENRLTFASLSTKVQTSESIARSRYPDYDEKFATFNQMVNDAPHLAEQAFQSPDPAEFVYKTAKMQKDLQDAGGIEQMRAKVEADLKIKIKAELEAEWKKREEELKKQRDDLPGSLTDVPSKGTNRAVWGGVPSLDDILKG